MIEKIEQKSNDFIWWILSLIFIVAGFGAHYYFSEYSFLLRVVGLLASIVVALWFSSKTCFGQKVICYWKEALVELRKIVWPTKKETTQTTMAVLAMIFAMGLFLWLVDSLLLALVGKILN